MGLITEKAATADSQERVLLYDFWRTLGGEERQQIRVADTATLATAVLRMHEARAIGVDFPSQDPTQLGTFNQDDVFLVGSRQLAKVHKHFELFYLNRL